MSASRKTRPPSRPSSRRSSKSVPGDMAEAVPEVVPGDIPEDMPEDMPEAVPEAVPEEGSLLSGDTVKRDVPPGLASGHDGPALLSGLVRRTPVISTPAVQIGIGAVSLKLENLQRTGSFKLRGAVRRLAALSDEERERGVVAASAGNHGAGIALAAARLGIKATIVVSAHTPQVKRDMIAGLGAQLVVDGGNYDEAEAMAKVRASASGALFVSPYDDDLVIDGNGGTLANELLSQVPTLARVVCPVGGGGLISGLAMKLAPVGIEVIGVQPENNCAMYESFEQGKALTFYDGKPTLAEGCEGPVAERTYAIARKHVTDIVVVSEAAIRRAVAFAYRAAGTIVECSGAVALAGFLTKVVTPARRGTTICVLSGGNIDASLLDEILASEKE